MAAPEHGVIDCDHVRRRPLGDVNWFDGDALTGRLHLALHEAVEQGGRLESRLLDQQRHARKRGVEQLADVLVIIDAENGHILGHSQSAEATAFRGLGSPLVVGAEQPHRPRKTPQPCD